MSPHLSPSQVEMALNCLLAAYPEVVARWAMGLMAEEAGR